MLCSRGYKQKTRTKDTSSYLTMSLDITTGTYCPSDDQFRGCGSLRANVLGVGVRTIGLGGADYDRVLTGRTDADLIPGENSERVISPR